MSSDYQRFTKAVVAKARKDGWVVTTDSKDHYKLRSPNGQHRITLARSSRSIRGLANARSQCKKVGLNV